MFSIVDWNAVPVTNSRSHGWPFIMCSLLSVCRLGCICDIFKRTSSQRGSSIPTSFYDARGAVA